MRGRVANNFFTLSPVTMVVVVVMVMVAMVAI